MATSKIPMTDKLSYFDDFNRVDASTYTCKVTMHQSDRRFPIIILKANQLTGIAPIGATVNNLYNANQILFSDTGVTYDGTTNTLTVYNGESASAFPAILYPRDYVSFSRT